jgi:hypothetical protein
LLAKRAPKSRRISAPINLTRKKSISAREDIEAGKCGLLSDLFAGSPREKDKACDQSRDDQHPVLAFKTQKYKTLDEKLHRSRPQFWAE